MKKEVRFIDEREIVANATEKDFSSRVAKAMLGLKSSHVYFVLQQAYGDISWEACELILEKMTSHAKRKGEGGR